MDLLTSHPVPCILSQMDLVRGQCRLSRIFCTSARNLARILIWLCFVSVVPPLSRDLPSPTELLNGRVYQTNLPVVLKPSFSADGDINVKRQLRQDKQKVQYDKTARQPVRLLFPEDRIRVFNPASGTWTPGIVQHVADTPRSYLIATERRGTLRKNRYHLRATGESFQFRSDEVPDHVPVADSISCAADCEERSTGSAPVSNVSTACSSAEPPESISPSSTADPSPALAKAIQTKRP